MWIQNKKTAFSLVWITIHTYCKSFSVFCVCMKICQTPPWQWWSHWWHCTVCWGSPSLCSQWSGCQRPETIDRQSFNSLFTLTLKTYKRVLKACHHPWAGSKPFHFVDMLLDIWENELMRTLAQRPKYTFKIQGTQLLNEYNFLDKFITLSVRKLCPRAWSSQQTSRSLTRLNKESIWRSFDLDSECQSILAAPSNFKCPPLSFITFSSRNSQFFIHCISFTVRDSQGISVHSFPHLLPRETFLAMALMQRKWLDQQNQTGSLG